jgi:hypothetical protein
MLNHALHLFSDLTITRQNTYFFFKIASARTAATYQNTQRDKAGKTGNIWASVKILSLFTHLVLINQNACQRKGINLLCLY